MSKITYRLEILKEERGIAMTRHYAVFVLWMTDGNDSSDTPTAGHHSIADEAWQHLPWVTLFLNPGL